MQTVSSLQAVKQWLEQLLQDVKYQRPTSSGRVDEYHLCCPAVHLGWIPFGFVADHSEEIKAPCLIVGAEEVDADEESTAYQIRITAVIYDPGHQQKQEEMLHLSANFAGYQTLINLLDLVRAALLRERVIAKRFSLEGAVKMKTYEEQPWPYWYGTLQFVMSDAGYPQTCFADILNE